MLVLIDVGLGNINSVGNMLLRSGSEAVRRSSPDGLSDQDRYILPGVGAWDEGVRRLQATGWFDHLAALPQETPILGICLGMQLLGCRSEEGVLPGLKRVPASFVRFPTDRMPVPHMGWNVVRPRAEDNFFGPEVPEPRFYFSHTYYAECEDPGVVLGVTDYGVTFPAAYRLGGSCGVQFHPEKSHRFGLSMFTNWVARTC